MHQGQARRSHHEYLDPITRAFLHRILPTSVVVQHRYSEYFRAVSHLQIEELARPTCRGGLGYKINFSTV